MPKHQNRTCKECGILKPVEHYTGKNRLCNGCLAAKAYKTGSREDAKALSAAIGQKNLGLARGLRDRSKKYADVPHITDVAAEASRQFGGPENVIKALKYHLDYAGEVNPGSKVVIDGYNGLIRLFAAASASIDRKEELETMSDMELEKIVVEAILKTKAEQLSLEKDRLKSLEDMKQEITEIVIDGPDKE